MSTPKIKIDNNQIDIKIPQQLHLIRPHSHVKQRPSTQHDIPIIKQQTDTNQGGDINNTPHKIRHVKTIDDKGQFIDQNHHSRVSENDQVRETITRTLHLESELPGIQRQLERIVEEGVCYEGNSKPLKHINIENIQDKDQFNLKNSRQKQNKRKRRLSDSNVESYIAINSRFSIVEYLNQHQKAVPEKIIEQEAQFDKRQKQNKSPFGRERNKSVHTLHKHRSSNSLTKQIQRMIVDQIDKKKKVRNQQQIYQDIQQARMEQIKQQRQQDEAVNTSRLQRELCVVQKQIGGLTKVVGREIGPEQLRNFVVQQEVPINEEVVEERQE